MRFEPKTLSRLKRWQHNARRHDLLPEDLRIRSPGTTRIEIIVGIGITVAHLDRMRHTDPCTTLKDIFALVGDLEDNVVSFVPSPGTRLRIAQRGDLRLQVGREPARAIDADPPGPGPRPGKRQRPGWADAVIVVI